MSGESDPMLGNPDERQAYLQKIRRMMEDEMEAIRKERARLSEADKINSPLIIGAQGYGDGARSI